jgi:8-oxo-dGTP pyrophosphatase MutT (NUDIX family)
MRKLKRDIAGMLVHSVDEQIIMGLKRPEPECNGPYANTWVLPGGVIEDGETALEAAIRETITETGSDLSEYQATLVDDKGKDEAGVTLRSGERVLYQMNFRIYGISLVKPASEVPLTTGDELARAEWVPVRDLNRYELCPPSIILFHKLGYMAAASIASE